MTQPAPVTETPLSERIEQALEWTGHPYSPYPMSTGEPWCRHCGKREADHSDLSPLLRESKETLATQASEIDRLSQALSERERDVNNLVDRVVKAEADRDAALQKAERGCLCVERLGHFALVATTLCPVHGDFDAFIETWKRRDAALSREAETSKAYDELNEVVCTMNELMKASEAREARLREALTPIIERLQGPSNGHLAWAFTWPWHERNVFLESVCAALADPSPETEGSIE